MEDKSSHSARANSPNRLPDQVAEGAPPIRRVRTDTQMEVDIAQENDALGARTISYVRQSANRRGPNVTNQENVENAYTDLMQGCTAHRILFLIGNPLLAPPHASARPYF